MIAEKASEKRKTEAPRLSLDEPDGYLGSEPVEAEEDDEDADQDGDTPPLVVKNELWLTRVVVSLREEAQDGDPEVLVDVLLRDGVRKQLEDGLLATKGGVEKLNIRGVANNSGEAGASLVEDLCRRFGRYLQHAANDAVDVQAALGHALQVVEVRGERRPRLDDQRAGGAIAAAAPQSCYAAQKQN